MTPFGVALRRAMTRRGMTRSQTAAAAGLSVSGVSKLLAGMHEPEVPTATRLAEALDWPSLGEMVLAARTGTCPMCGATFVASLHGPTRKWCSRLCAKADHARRQRERSRRATLTETRMTRKRLDDHQRAVAAFCVACEPEGLCRDAECPLRGVSPLPLARRRAA